MSHTFAKLYDQQVESLERAGYSSKNLDTNQADVQLYGSLLVKFLEVYQKCTKNRQPKLFYITKTGFFGEDQVKFVFSYLYDPNKEELALNWLDVTLKGVSHEIDLKCNNDLPTAHEAYKSVRGIYNKDPKKKRDDLLQSIIQHRKILLEKGYDHVGLNNNTPIEQLMDKLVNALKEGLFQNLHLLTYKVPIDFKVDTVGLFNNNLDKISFEFNYEYDPENITFQLRTLHAEMDTIKSYYLRDASDLPHSNEVYKEFIEDRRLVNEIVPALQDKYGIKSRLR
jgi:hypothetical protein